MSSQTKKASVNFLAEIDLTQSERSGVRVWA